MAPAIEITLNESERDDLPVGDIGRETNDDDRGKRRGRIRSAASASFKKTRKIKRNIAKVASKGGAQLHTRADHLHKQMGELRNQIIIAAKKLSKRSTNESILPTSTKLLLTTEVLVDTAPAVGQNEVIATLTKELPEAPNSSQETTASQHGPSSTANNGIGAGKLCPLDDTFDMENLQSGQTAIVGSIQKVATREVAKKYNFFAKLKRFSLKKGKSLQQSMMMAVPEDDASGETSDTYVYENQEPQVSQDDDDDVTLVVDNRTSMVKRLYSQFEATEKKEREAWRHVFSDLLLL